MATYRFNRLWLGLVLVLLLISTGAKADDGQADSATVKEPLKGGVKGAALLTDDGLVKMGEAAQELKSASTLVITEVTRKGTAYLGGPNVIGNGVVIPAIGGTSGTIPFGDLPARKKQLTRFVNNTIYYAELLENEVNALILPDQRSPELASGWDSIRSQVDEIHNHVARLRELSVGPKYDNIKIGKEALAINDRSKTVNKLRQQVQQMLTQK